jgi:hypothetical protein
MRERAKAIMKPLKGKQIITKLLTDSVVFLPPPVLSPHRMCRS